MTEWGRLETSQEVAPNGLVRLTILGEPLPERIGVTLDLIQAADSRSLRATSETIAVAASNGWATYRVIGWHDFALDCELVAGEIDR